MVSVCDSVFVVLFELSWFDFVLFCMVTTLLFPSLDSRCCFLNLGPRISQKMAGRILQTRRGFTTTSLLFIATQKLSRTASTRTSRVSFLGRVRLTRVERFISSPTTI